MRYLLIIAFTFYCMGCSTPAKPVKKRPVDITALTEASSLVENFDSGIAMNSLGGKFGAWDVDDKDSSQSCRMEFFPDQNTGVPGYCLKLIYDVDSSNPSYNGLWMELKGEDFSYYRKLCIDIRGDSKAGFPRKIKVELKNSGGETGLIMIDYITNKWKTMDIPFINFRGISDFSEMSELVLVFEDGVTEPKTGTIYIDNIMLKK